MAGRISIYVLTWNILGQPPSEDLQKMLGLDEIQDESSLPDFYVIGLQEVNAKPHSMIMGMLFEDSWSQAFKDLLSRWDYVKVKCVRLQGLLLLLFCLRHHVIHLRSMETEYTRTGFGGIWGNKGGVTIRLNIYGCSICLVNTHLAAHDHMVKQRIQDYSSIVDGQVFHDPETQKILFHDYVFLFGDLNFRTDDLTSEEIKYLSDKKEYATLLSYDQLRRVMRKGEAFSEFEELDIDFSPTYKFNVGTDDYDLKRKPSYTDRILYKVNHDAYENMLLDLMQENYISHMSYLQSDHKPVSALFSIKVRSCEEFVHQQAVFAHVGKWYLYEGNAAEYMLLSVTGDTSRDWIGLYKAGFSCLDEYITYVWASPNSGGANASQQVCPDAKETPNRKGRTLYRALSADDDETSPLLRVTFPEIEAPGSYCLVYVSSGYSNILGMSEVFDIVAR